MSSEVELVTILECASATHLALARSLLEDADPYMLNGERFGPASEQRAFIAFTGDAPFRLQVAHDRATEARALVAHLKG